MPNIPLANRLANYSTGLRFEDLTKDVVHEVKRRVIDSLGCALGAWTAEPAVIARRIASSFSATQGATLWGTRHIAPPDWAAFANGVLVRYLDYNDTYLSKEPAHPSDNIPAAVAIAESIGASGRELITAIVAAYEVQCRLCDATSIRAIGWDHVTYGCFSVAVAASKLMNLDFEHTRHAIGIAGVSSAALRQTRVGELSHWKGCAFADAARQGVFAGILAREGMTGPAPIFEGAMGFEKLVSGALPIAGPFADGGSSERDCMITRTSIKCWPAEYHAQSAIEAALKIRPRIPSPADIEFIVVESHDAAVDIIGSEPEKWIPTSRETADHSLPYMTAAALMDGDITHRQFSEERIADKTLLALVGRVKVLRHLELSALYPKAVGNIVTVKLKDGKTFTERVDYPCGHSGNRMSDERVEEKFHALADPVLGRERAGQLADWVWQLDDAPSLDEMMELLEKEGPH